MITELKIKIYKKYKGDIDSWVRSGSKNEKLAINDNEWYLIDNFLQEIHLVKNELASKEFENKLNNRLNENCENYEVIEYLKTLVVK